MSQASTILNKSPRKVRLIIDPIRGMSLALALEVLRSMPKGKTKKVYDLLKSAASNLSLTPEEYSNYTVGEIVAEEAQRLYRVVPRARGSAFRIRRRYTRIRVKLAKQ